MANTDYVEVPRGRVLYQRQNKKFIVYLDQSLATPKIKTAIKNTFALASKVKVFRFDPHYTIDPDILNEMFGD